MSEFMPITSPPLPCLIGLPPANPQASATKAEPDMGGVMVEVLPVLLVLLVLLVVVMTKVVNKV